MPTSKYHQDKFLSAEPQVTPEPHWVWPPNKIYFLFYIFVSLLFCNGFLICVSGCVCRYWLFSDEVPGLFIEKGWVHDSIDYRVSHRRRDRTDSQDESHCPRSMYR